MANCAPERRAAGCYTIDEAKQEILAGAGEAVVRSIGSTLVRAVDNGNLIAYRPGEVVPYRPSAPAAWLECYGDDLNAWLGDAVPRLVREGVEINRAVLKKPA